jgi:hypothetical protein
VRCRRRRANEEVPAGVRVLNRRIIISNNVQAGQIIRRLLGEARKCAAVGDGQTRKCLQESEC